MCKAEAQNYLKIKDPYINTFTKSIHVVESTFREIKLTIMMMMAGSRRCMALVGILSRSKRSAATLQQQQQQRQRSNGFSSSTSVLRQKSVLVTGGARGLGAAICQRLSDDGYSVVVGDILEEEGQGLVSSSLNNSSSYVKLDVSDPKQMEAAIQYTVEQHGRLDALVNNAGIVSPQVPLAEFDIEEWKKGIDINLNGTFFGLKFGLQQMVKQQGGDRGGGGGCIVNMSSTAGFRGYPKLGPYTASKFAVKGMTQAAAVEYAKYNIRVNAIAPTGVETPLVKQFIEESPDPEAFSGMITAQNALSGFPQPEDVADACAFLLNDREARYITGHTLPVDAGALARVANAKEIDL